MIKLAQSDAGFSLDGQRPAGDIVDPSQRPSEMLAMVSVLKSRFRGQLWEQLALWQARPKDVLLNLCNIGPILRKRQVVMVHDAQIFTQPQAYSRAFRLWYRFAIPRLVRSAQLVVTVSEFSRQELERFAGLPKGRAVVVHNGGDHILRHAAEPDILGRHSLEKDGYILVVGSQAPHKNLDMLARAAAARDNQSIPLVVAGGGGAVFAGQSTGIRHLGRVSDGEMRALYENAMALALPSLTEGFGLTALEAMYCGCPVIATTGGAVPEVCGDAAAYADPMEPHAWTMAMEALAGDPERRKALSTAGLERSARFTWSKAAETFRQALGERFEEQEPA